MSCQRLPDSPTCLHIPDADGVCQNSRSRCTWQLRFHRHHSHHLGLIATDLISKRVSRFERLSHPLRHWGRRRLFFSLLLFFFSFVIACPPLEATCPSLGGPRLPPEASRPSPPRSRPRCAARRLARGSPRPHRRPSCHKSKSSSSKSQRQKRRKGEQRRAQRETGRAADGDSQIDR